MKRKIQCAICILFGAVTFSNAQFEVFNDDFSEGDISEWTIVDEDGDGNTWVANKNIIDDDGAPSFTGPNDVLVTYGYDFNEGEDLEDVEDWAVTPEIDLSAFTGQAILTINAQPSIYTGDVDLDIYVSTVAPNVSDIGSTFGVAVGTIELLGDGASNVFNDYTIDLSAYLGEETVYIALVNGDSGGFIGYEINEVTLTTSALLSNGDELNKKEFKIVENPVVNSLKLQANSSLENPTVSIYNINGAIVKTTPYTIGGIAVNTLSRGIYIAKIQTANHAEEVIKFIKK